MHLVAILIDSIWAGLFAAAMAVVFSSPYWGLPFSFAGGFVARFARDVLIAGGAGSDLAVLIAAALVVVVAACSVRRPGISPLVMISAILPLGAATPFFRAIVDFLAISSLRDDRAAGVPLVLVTNLSKVFTTTVAIGVGMSAAMYVVRSLRREPGE